MAIANAIRKSALPVSVVTRNRWEALKDLIGESEVVMIGEASHGTQEFYQARADITRMLIEDKGFNFVAVEGDWPSTYRLHRWVVGSSTDETVTDALDDFQRFPRWMWRNEVVAKFGTWLHEFNQNKPPEQRVGFYGLDLYSLFESADAVINYLDERDKKAADKARELYSTIDMFREEASEYGEHIWMGGQSREKEVCKVLTDLLKNKMEYVKSKGYVNGEEYFYTVENAKLVKDAEEYYRNTYMGGVRTWNLRDKHMLTTLEDLMKHHADKLHKEIDISIRNEMRDRVAQMSTSELQKFLETQEIPTKNLERKEMQSVVESYLCAVENKNKVKCVVWAHNSHLGDAKATEMRLRREFNLGQLVRERFGLSRSFNIGFTTNEGTVRAARSWGGAAEVMSLNPGCKGSYEELFRLVTKAKAIPGVDIQLKQIDAEEKQDEDQDKKETKTAHDPTTVPLPVFGLGLRTNRNTTFLVSEEARNILSKSRLERFIGVQYVKRTERESHYYACNLPHQFDALIHFENSYALKSLDLK